MENERKIIVSENELKIKHRARSITELLVTRSSSVNNFAPVQFYLNVEFRGHTDGYQ